MLIFAFYKARPGRIADRIIRLASWSRYSHVEFVLDQSEGETTCISASKRDGSIVRVKAMRMNPDHWDYVTIPGDHAAARMYAESQIGTRYNMIGAALSITPITARLGRGLFCSQFMGLIAGVPDSHTLTPGELHDILEARVRMNRVKVVAQQAITVRGGK